MTSPASRLRVGEPVYAIGAPQGLELSLSGGLVSALRTVRGELFIQTDAAISRGSSGGGLFDQNARLVGITTFYLDGGQNLNFAIPIERVMQVAGQAVPRGFRPFTGELDAPGAPSQPIGPGPPATRSPAQWSRDAQALSERKDWRGLLALAQDWIKAHPDSADALLALANAQEELGQVRDATQTLRQAVHLQPRNSYAWTFLGILLGKLDDNEGALQAFRTAVSISGETAALLTSIGATLAVQGHEREAIQHLEQATRVDPRYASAWFQLAAARSRANDDEGAVVALEEAVRINPQFGAAWQLLAPSTCRRIDPPTQRARSTGSSKSTQIGQRRS
jgi:Tfp pilus assembly protein PilF